MLLALLFYGYATGIFSSRALERATYELIPVIYITGNTHPDPNGINPFRQRFLGELKDLFVQILLRA
jgi:transposase